MSALTGFLLARIAEDEAVARAAIDPAYGTDAQGRWVVISIPYEGSWPRDPDYDGNQGDASEDEWAIHASRHDPARVLAECAARRQIVEQCAPYDDLQVRRQTRMLAGDTLRALASVYADAPGFRAEWAL